MEKTRIAPRGIESAASIRRKPCRLQETTASTTAIKCSLTTFCTKKHSIFSCHSSVTPTLRSPPLTPPNLMEAASTSISHTHPSALLTPSVFKPQSVAHRLPARSLQSTQPYTLTKMDFTAGPNREGKGNQEVENESAFEQSVFSVFSSSRSAGGVLIKRPASCRLGGSQVVFPT